MSSSRRLICLILVLSASLLALGCTKRMRLKMDAAWETIDPMGHRSEHRARNYPRGRNSGMRLPEGYQKENPPPLPGSTRAW